VTPIERATFLLHAELDDFQARIASAKRIISDALKQSKHPYVAYSGGKDSLVMAHMVLLACPDAQIWHFWYGPYYFPVEMENEVLRAAHTIGAANTRIDTSEKYRQGRSQKNVFFPTLHGKIIPRLLSEGYDLAFIGLRKEESGRRKAKAAKHMRCDGQMIECYPIADLTARDIWAYIVTHNLPYCSHYDRYGVLLGIEQVRMSTFFDSEFDRLGAGNLDGILMTKFKHPTSRQ